MSADLVTGAEIKVGANIGSDHLPIHLKLQLCPSSIQPQLKRQRWKLPKVDNQWTEWTKALAAVELSVNPGTPIEEKLEIFTTVIKLKSANIFDMTKPMFRPKHSRPWWNQDCSKQVALRRKAYRQYERHRTTENKIKYKRQFAVPRRTICVAKCTSWRIFTSNLTFQTPSRKIWAIIKSISGISSPSNTPLIHQGTAVSVQEKADLFGNVLESTASTRANITLSPVQCNRQYKRPENASLQNYNCPISNSELQTAIVQYIAGKGKAMDSDLFHKLFLVYLPPQFKTYLLEMLNTVWKTGDIPKIWKHSLIIPLPKPSKDPTNIANLRPISLLSCLGKLMEKIVHTRLY